MIRLVTFFIIVAALAIGAGWLADRPGVMSIDWQGYQIQLSLMTAIILIVALIAIAVFLHSLYRLVIRSPGVFGGYLKGRRRDKGYAALSQGMLAVGAGDTAGARKFAYEASRLLPDEPMTKLLEAQTAQASGKRAEAVATFNTMLESPATKMLALRGLYLEAKRENNIEAAETYAADALAAAPGVPWAGNAMFEFQCAKGDWDGALQTLQILTERKVVDKATARRRRAVLLTAHGLDLEDGEPDKALALALEAHGLAMDLVPAATLASRLSSRLGNIRRASSVVEQTWRQNPHPELADAFARARPGDSVRDRYRRVRALAQKAAHNTESRIALAIAAIDAQDWKVARETLMALAKTEPTVRVCRLMAEVEEGETGDSGKARAWLARAVQALPDPAWTADGYVSDTWLPVSPVSGRLDAFEWKVPVSALQPATDAAIEAIATPVPDLAAPAPATMEKPRAEADPAPEVETSAAPEPANVEPAPDEPAEAEAPAEDTSPDAAKAASDDVAEPVVDGDDVEEPSANVTPLHLPDDPGLGGADTEDEDKPAGKRFGLF
ncbi:MAG: heme biosynthesis protein HemY [Rhodobiaceae bacterium]|nr:heme biosynthesis protein HemY [Rhodobiaceae bacterium]